MWQEASSDYLQQWNRRVQLAHNPRWANVRVPTQNTWPMLVEHRQKELQEMAKLRAEIKKLEAVRKADVDTYTSQLQGYTADIARFKKQYSNKVLTVRDGHSASRGDGGGSSGGGKTVADTEKAVEPSADDGECPESEDGLDDEPAPSGVQADLH